MPRLNNFKKSMPTANDEKYTPKLLTDVIVKYTDPSLKVWCPFDTENSEFVHSLHENGNEVIYSHLHYGQDFFEYGMRNCLNSASLRVILQTW